MKGVRGLVMTVTGPTPEDQFFCRAATQPDGKLAVQFFARAQVAIFRGKLQRVSQRLVSTLND
jgi:hypothetical protein